MKATLALGIIAIAALVIFLARRTEPDGPLIAADPPPVASKVEPRPDPPKIEHVQKLPKPERARLADRIAEAKTTRATMPTRVAKRPELPATVAPTLDPEDVDAAKTTIRAAMREVAPLLIACFDEARPELGSGKRVAVEAKLTLTGDLDIGTVIDAHQITDDKGLPILASFDECLRDTLQQLALPALAADKLEITYPFVFSAD